MELRHLGYAGQNLTLGVTTGRTLRLANLGNERVSQVIASNLAGLRSILEWNVAHGIGMFRIGSQVVPFASHPDFGLDWRDRFSQELAEIREFVQRNRLRLSMHPGQYTVLNSPNEQVVRNAVSELRYHAEFLGEVDPTGGTIVLHVGGAYGEKERAMERFVEQASKLGPPVLRYLAVENDDTTFDLDDALEVATGLGVPVIFDFLHHLHNHDWPQPHSNLAARLADVVATWKGRTPKFHLSSAREPGSSAHADYISADDLLGALRTLSQVHTGREFDLMLEAKAKDRAVLRAQEAIGRREGGRIIRHGNDDTTHTQ